MEILSNKIFRLHLNRILKLGINSNKIIKINQKYIINKCKKFLCSNNKISLKDQADLNKKQGDSFQIQIKVLIGITKI
jgi:hypothetical protein